MVKKRVIENKLSAAETDRRRKRITLLICFALSAGIIAAYEPIRHNGFVGYDDPDYIVKNPHVTGGITAQSIKWALTEVYASNWHPLTWISHMIDCQLFDLHPFGHHLVSVLFHITNTLLLFLILRNITGAVWASAFAAAVFATHPVQAESVAWAAERKTVLSGLFWFITIALYVRYARQPRLSRYILVFLMFGLSIMTKPVVVTLPFVLLLLDYWPLERISKKTVVRLIVEKIPLVAIAAISSVVTFVAQKSGGAVSTAQNMPLDERFANAFGSYITYIGKIFWPSALAVYNPHPRTGFSITTAVCAVFLIAITIFCIYAGRRKKYLAVGWLWFVGTLVPMIGIVQVGAQAYSFRYMYLSIAGLLIIVAWSVKDIVTSKPGLKVAAVILSIAAIISLIALTRTQVRHWQNSLTLFGYTLEVTGDNAAAEMNYGNALFEAGRLDEAEKHIQNAIRLVPVFPEAQNDLGKVYLQEGKNSEAIKCFEEGIKTPGAPVEVYYNLATALIMQKRYDEAIKQLKVVLERDPGYPHAPSTMCVALMSAGRADEAIACFNKYLLLNGNSIELNYNLAVALFMQKKYEEAIKHFERVVELDPKNAGAFNGLARTFDALAISYADTGKFEEAKAAGQKALNAAKAAGQTALANEIEGRLQLYNKGLPYQGK